MLSYSIEELKQMGIQVHGNNIKISKFVNIYNPKNLILHDNIRIDDFTIISCKGIVEIFNYVHIGAHCFVSSATKIVFGNYSCISPGVKLFGACDDFSGEFMTNPVVPSEFLNVTTGDIIFESHALVGSNSVVLPNVVLAEGTAIASLSLVKKNTERWTIYGGIPIKKIKERSNNCKELEHLLHHP